MPRSNVANLLVLLVYWNKGRSRTLKSHIRLMVYIENTRLYGTVLIWTWRVRMTTRKVFMRYTSRTRARYGKNKLTCPVNGSLQIRMCKLTLTNAKLCWHRSLVEKLLRLPLTCHAMRPCRNRLNVLIGKVALA